MNKFIKKIERIVRSSPEYREWTGYVKDCLGHYVCELTGEISSQVTVEIHHHPISMFVITKGILTEYINSNKEFCSFDIAQDVITLHYENRIGYIPLVRTLHEKFHNGFVQIPMELIKGDWMYLLDHYEYSDSDLETIDSRTAINFTNCGWADGQYSWSGQSRSEAIGMES